MNLSGKLRKNIIICLDNKHLTQNELAVLCNLHESVISRILSGKRELNVKHLAQIAKALDIDIVSLIYYPDEVIIVRKTEKQVIINL